VHDGSRTHLEARIAFPVVGDEEDEFVTPTRRFSLHEITSGLPDDSRDADERAEARRLRYLRGQVKSARRLASATPGLRGVLQADWRRAAWFYARFGVTEAEFRLGAPASEGAYGKGI
jgi:hypothetical protein